MQNPYGKKIASGSYRLGPLRVEIFVMESNDGEYTLVEDNGHEDTPFAVKSLGHLRRLLDAGPSQNKRNDYRAAVDKVLREAAEAGMT